MSEFAAARVQSARVERPDDSVEYPDTGTAMPEKADNRELQELARIADKVRKEMTLELGEWLWKDWDQRFAEGLLACGVTVSEHKQRQQTT